MRQLPKKLTTNFNVHRSNISCKYICEVVIIWLCVKILCAVYFSVLVKFLDVTHV